jgi:hypothetical protein
MTTLYRSPSLIIDAHEWHVAVYLKDGHTFTRFRWRPLSIRNYHWSNIKTWKGPRPKDLGDKFWRFRLHVRLAMESEARRREAAGVVAKLPTAAVVANVGLEMAA